MPLADTTRNIRLDGTTLLADCKGADGKYKPATLALNDHLGIVDGHLKWGYKGFSQSAKNIRLEGTQIVCEIKGGDGKWIVQKADLNTHIVNNKGVLDHPNRAVTPKPGRTASPVDLKLPETPSRLRTVSSGGNGVYGASALASAASASSLATSASASSMFSQSSMSSSTSYESHTTSKQSFSQSTFRSQSMQMSIRETCFNLVLEGSLLWADCLLMDGQTRQRSSIDLDQYIGLVNGQLVFGAKGFTKHKHLRNIRLEGFIIYAEVYTEGLGERWIEISLDISEKFKNKNGILIAVTMNADLSVMLSEVPWMKFKVIAEPDMSVFARHPVMQQTMTSIAESTVEHVTLQMSSMIQTAIQQAVSVVTQSAMVHIQESMELMVQDVVGYGRAHGSATAAGELRLSAGMGASLSGGVQFGAEGGYAYGAGAGAGVSGGYAYGSGSAGGVAYGASGGSFSTSETHLTGGAMLTSSSGILTSASESQEEFFTNSVKAGGKAVSVGRINSVVETAT